MLIFEQRNHMRWDCKKILKPKELKSPVSGHREIMWYIVYGGDQISHIQSMVAKRGLTNWPNVHTPVKKSNQSSNFACNWTSFHSTIFFFTNADARVRGGTRGDQKPETSFFGLRVKYKPNPLVHYIHVHQCSDNLHTSYFQFHVLVTREH